MIGISTSISNSEKRLFKASGAAVVFHLIIAVAGFYALDWLSVPSNLNRVLVVNLDSTLFDGLDQQHPLSLETSNQLETAKVKPQTQAQLEDSPSSELKALEKPLVKEQTKAFEPIQAAARQSKNEFAIETSSLPVEQIGSNILTAELSTIVVNVERREIPDRKETEIYISESQTEMLEQKLTDMAEQLSQLEKPSETIEWEHNDQLYTASFEHYPAEDSMSLDEMRVQVQTLQDGKNLSTEMRLKKLAFSNFGQFVHRWDPDLQVHDDEMDGRFHSNSLINLEFDRDAGPVFRGKVTTASYKVNMTRSHSRAKKDQVFLGGLETGVKKISMPKPRSLFSNQTLENMENSILFEQDTRIVFQADGSYFFQTIAPGATPQWRSVGEQPHYMLASKGATLYLRGTVNGKVLVYSPRRIVIEGHLIYASHPVENESDDYLGLVSDRTIAVAKHNVTGPGDLHVHAAIYTKGRFLVRRASARRTGTLSIIGSLSADSISETEPRYATNIIFDQRLEENRPPNFPNTQHFELAQVSTQWSEQPALRSE